MNKIRTMLASLALLITGAALAEGAVKDLADARQRVQETLHELDIEAFEATDKPDLYLMTFQGREFMVLVNEELVVIGEVFEQGNPVSLNQQQERANIQTVLSNLPEDRFIVFGDESLPHEVTIFTDVTCPYCKQMHRGVDALNEAGIRVRYLLYPRDRPGSEIWNANESVWCADDRQAAMTAAKMDEDVKEKTCDNTLQETFDAGVAVGLRGTPMIILENGAPVPEGYLPPEALIQRVQDETSSGS